jgi:hypothetical protein
MRITKTKVSATNMKSGRQCARALARVAGTNQIFVLEGAWRMAARLYDRAWVEYFVPKPWATALLVQAARHSNL